MVQEMHKRSDYGFWYVPDNLSFPVLRFPDVYDKLEELGKKYGLYDFKRQFALDSWVQKDLLMGINIWTFIDPYDKEIRKAAGKLHWEIEELYGAKGATWLNMYPPMVSDWAWKNQPSAHELFKKIKGLLDPNDVMENIQL